MPGVLQGAPMELRFDGMRALVTGAGRGIGRGVVERLASFGADVIALDIDQQNLDSLTREFPRVRVVRVDLRDWHETREVVQRLGPLDLLVNNAVIPGNAPFLAFEEDMLDRMVDVNFKSVFNVSQVVAAGMVERGQGGVIVNMSSMAAKIALDTRAAYCSCKAAIDSLTRVMALELGPYNIRVNSVCPNITMTELARVAWSDPSTSAPYLDRTPLGRFNEVSDVVDAVVFLLSDGAQMIHGSSIAVDGGLLCC